MKSFVTSPSGKVERRERKVSIADSFLAEWLALPPKDVPSILDKIKLLTEDPTPDAKTKKQLKYIGPRLHRIRCGDYRIFYTSEGPYISLLSVQRRKFNEIALGGHGIALAFG